MKKIIFCPPFLSIFSKSAKKGFTLIELLVVVLIIGILASVAIPQYNQAVLKTRAISTLTMYKAIVGAQERYHLENDSFPTDFTLLGLDFPNECEITTDASSAFDNDVLYCKRGLPGQYIFRLYQTSRISMSFRFAPTDSETLINISHFSPKYQGAVTAGVAGKFVVDITFKQFTPAHKRFLNSLGAKPTSNPKYYEFQF